MLVKRWKFQAILIPLDHWFNSESHNHTAIQQLLQDLEVYEWKLHVCRELSNGRETVKGGSLKFSLCTLGSSEKAL